MNTITLRSGKTRIDFDCRTAALKAIFFNRARVAAGTGELFTLRLRKNDNSSIFISGSEFSTVKFEESGFNFSGCACSPQLHVRINVQAGDGMFLFRPVIRGISDDMRLELIDTPQIAVEAKRDLFHPRSEGGIMFHPEKKNYTPPEIDDPEFYIDNYPGRCQMQFMAASRNGSGIYFAAHDPEGTPKRIIYSGIDGGKRVRLRLETFCSGTQNEYCSPFPYVLCGFSGDWMDACEIHRDWAEKAFALQPECPVPEWMKDSPVTLIYPVCGNGTIQAETNEFFPYVKGMKYVNKFARLLNSRIMALLMRWDQNGPWLPPEIWPPAGGEKRLAEYRDQLHAAGHLLGLYGSGTAWTLKSHTNTYDATNQFHRKKLHDVMCQNAHGEIYENVMPGIRNGYYMCMTEEYPREIIKSQILAMAKFGVDFLQFFDQNLGCNNYLCCAKNHRHPPLPGAWSTSSMQELLAELNAILKESGIKMLLGTEGAAAEPYVSQLPFNDLRSSLYFGDRPVPAYQYVFHQYCHDFMGNQVHMSHCLKLKESPDNLLFRIAYSFNAGVMLSVPMRNNGLIDWGNDGDWSLTPPDQKSAITLLKNLNEMRRTHPEIFLHGRMLKPKIKLDGRKYILHHQKRKIIFDRFFNSAWITPDKKHVQVITNFLPEIAEISGSVPTNCNAFWNGHTLKNDFSLKLPPLSATLLWLL